MNRMDPVPPFSPGPASGTGAAPAAVAVVLLSETSLVASSLPAGPVSGFAVRVLPTGPASAVSPAALAEARVIVAEVDPASEASWMRLEALLRASRAVPVAAAIAAPTHADMRRCLRLGAFDVIPLPLVSAELAPALEHAWRAIGAAAAPRKSGRTIAFIKSVGGVGATALATQAGCLLARRDQARGRETCLMDLDIQFGNAALYLGLSPALSFHDLLLAGDRADEALLRDVTTSHVSGLQIIAAPPEIMPLDMVTPEQLGSLLDIAAREFPTLLLDLPGAWTHWSLSAVARADALCLVTELSVPSLRHARRQIDMLRQSDMDGVPLHVVANRVERSFWKPISVGDAEQVLGRGISFTVSNDFRTLSAAIDQGVQVGEIRSKSRIERDLAAMISELLPVEAGEG